MNKFITWHKNKIVWWKSKTGMTDYQLLWVSFAKGIIIGAILL